MKVLASAVRRPFRLAMACLLSCFLAVAAGPAGANSHSRLYFDMPQQPLNAALASFQDVADLPLLYDSDGVRARRAQAVRGWYTPVEALRRLVQGSGMAVRHAGGGVAMLVPTAPAAGTAAARRAPSGQGRDHALLQWRITQSLCADPATQPGGYRLALRVWVEQQRIVRVVLAPTGDAARDDGVRQALQGLSVPGLSPAAQGQPVALLIEPQAQPGRDCHAR
ncbi:STN domain-containing protein [Orrella sp. JC864]|uniref:STN domain-containing protein n=1 Tax=Orrella sp. JC864 TaxID=3120298 RepID=UPI003009D696